LRQIISRDESVILNFFGSFENLIYLALVDSLDIAQLLLGCHDNAGNRAKPTSFEFGDICSIDAVLL
jgi:hypothetical protein